MESPKLLLLFSLLTFSLLSEQGSAGHHHHHHRRRHFRPTKLFVFGDSYVDTGNIDLPVSSARNFPYGITFPGKPSGRFSDGRVLTDFTARFLGVKFPIPYTVLQKVGFRRFKNGVNFAFGGTGVFDTSVALPNMTTQIDFLQNLIGGGAFTGKELHSSVALVSVSGNDYSFFLARNGSAQGFKPFIVSVVNQMTVNLKRIHSLGVKKVLVMGLGPLGCVPQITAPSSFLQCNATLNSLAQFHNQLLNMAVAKLNNETRGSPFVVLDLFDSFMSIIQRKGRNWGFKTTLKPCCFGVSSGFSCGSVDEKGNKMFVLCKDRKSAFFWDSVHPTQEGWIAAFSPLKSTLRRL